MSITRLLTLLALAKHVFIGGASGSWKSSFARHVFIQLQMHGIPCTVLELAKKEWRGMKSLATSLDPVLRDTIAALQVYTVGNEAVNPLRLNPFEAGPGVGIDTAIGNLRRCFNGALAMFAPLPELIAVGVERMLYAFAEQDMVPTITDLHSYVLHVLDQKSYADELGANLRGAVDARFEALTTGAAGRLFQCAKSIPGPGSFLRTSKIFEMDELAKEDLTLALLFLLTRFWECAKATPAASGALRHVLFIEEAHVALGASGDARPNELAADPAAYVTEFICRMLAEFRGLGVGVVICDQSPHQVSPHILKNTGTKIAFRQQDAEDREAMANAMLLDPLRAEDLGRLRPGEAYLWTEGYYRPLKIRTVNWEEEYGNAHS